MKQEMVDELQEIISLGKKTNMNFFATLQQPELFTGYFATEHSHTKVHLVDQGLKPICRSKTKGRFHQYAKRVVPEYVECQHCLNKYQAYKSLMEALNAFLTKHKIGWLE